MLMLAERSLNEASTFADDVRAGLDEAGAEGAALQSICTMPSARRCSRRSALLPEYGLRARRIPHPAAARRRHRPPSRTRRRMVAELGSGSAKNTRWIVEALVSAPAPDGTIPIDISRDGARAGRARAGRDPSLGHRRLRARVPRGPRRGRARRAPGQRAARACSWAARSAASIAMPATRSCARCDLECGPAIALLLSTDLVQSADLLILAYDDPAGVTSAFDKNLLARVNRELGATFDLRAFDARGAVERARPAGRDAPALTAGTRSCRFRGRGSRSRFRTRRDDLDRSSHKYRLDELAAHGERTGFRCEAQWVDDEWPFAQNLFVVS